MLLLQQVDEELELVLLCGDETTPQLWASDPLAQCLVEIDRRLNVGDRIVKPAAIALDNRQIAERGDFAKALADLATDRERFAERR